MSAGIQPAVRSEAAIRARMRATGASGFSFRSCATPARNPPSSCRARAIIAPRKTRRSGQAPPPVGSCERSSAARSTRALVRAISAAAKVAFARAAEPASVVRAPGKSSQMASSRQACGPCSHWRRSTESPFFTFTATPRPHPSASAHSTQPRGEPAVHAPSANPAAPARSGGRCRSTRSRASRHSQGLPSSSQYAFDARSAFCSLWVTNPGMKSFPTRPQIGAFAPAQVSCRRRPTEVSPWGGGAAETVHPARSRDSRACIWAVQCAPFRAMG